MWGVGDVATGFKVVTNIKLSNCSGGTSLTHSRLK